MPIVEVNGENVEFPDNMSDAAIEKAISTIHGSSQKATKSDFAGEATGALVKGAGSAIGGAIAYATDPNYPGIAQLAVKSPEYASQAVQHPGQTIIGLGKGAGQGAVNLGNMVTTPGRLLAAGAPAFLGAAAGGANFQQASQAGSQAMQESSIPMPKAFTPANPTQELAAEYGRGGMELGSMVTPGGSAGLKAAEALKSGERAAGRKMMQAGKTSLESKLKIPHTLAKENAATVQAGRDQIMNDIINLKLEDKNPYKISEKAQNRIDDNEIYVDKKLKEADDVFKKENPDATFKPFPLDASFYALDKRITSGTEPRLMVLDPEGKIGHKLLINIKNAMEKEGYFGDITYREVPNVKRLIGREIKLFTRGTQGMKNAPIAESIGDKLYLQIKKDLEKDVPGIEDVNAETHRLLNVKEAANAAGDKLANKTSPLMTLEEKIGALGAGAVGLFHAGAQIDPATAAMVAAAYLLASKSVKGVAKIATEPANVIRLGRDLRYGSKSLAPGTVPLGTIGAAGALYQNQPPRYTGN